MRVRAFGCAGVLLVLALGSVHGGEPKSDPVELEDIAWSPADARVAQGDAPLYVQVRIEPDGIVALRSTSGGAKPVWSAYGTWRLTIHDPTGSMEALRGLHDAFEKVVRTRAQAPALWDEGGHSRARLLIDAAAGSFWRYAQWVIATGASPQTKVGHLTFSTLLPGGWIDLELPRDGPQDSPAGTAADATLLIVKLFRENLDRPWTEQFTKARLSREAASLVGLKEEVLLPEEEPPPPSPAKGSDVVVELPRAGVPSGAHALHWRALEGHLRNLAGTSLPVVGEVRAPFPKGLAVPYADACATLDLLQRIGCKQVLLEGAPPPKLRKEGGGWGFEGK